MRILIADDDVEMVDMTTYALRKQGYQIVTATDGRQAVQRWQEDRPDLVLLDVGLPRMNGIEVCRAIRERSTTPVIIVTGQSDEERVLQGFQAGAQWGACATVCRKMSQASAASPASSEALAQR